MERQAHRPDPFKLLLTLLRLSGADKAALCENDDPESDRINIAFTVMSQCGAIRGSQHRLRDNDDRSHPRC
jgi:hypothetical protein